MRSKVLYREAHLRKFIVESEPTKYSLFPVPAFVMTVQSRAASEQEIASCIRPKAVEPYRWVRTLLYRTSWILFVALVSYDILRHLK